MANQHFQYGRLIVVTLLAFSFLTAFGTKSLAQEKQATFEKKADGSTEAKFPSGNSVVIAPKKEGKQPKVTAKLKKGYTIEFDGKGSKKVTTPAGHEITQDDKGNFTIKPVGKDPVKIAKLTKDEKIAEEPKENLILAGAVSSIRLTQFPFLPDKVTMPDGTELEFAGWGEGRIALVDPDKAVIYVRSDGAIGTEYGKGLALTIETPDGKVTKEVRQPGGPPPAVVTEPKLVGESAPQPEVSKPPGDEKAKEVETKVEEPKFSSTYTFGPTPSPSPAPTIAGGEIDSCLVGTWECTSFKETSSFVTGGGTGFRVTFKSDETEIVDYSTMKPIKSGNDTTSYTGTATARISTKDGVARIESMENAGVTATLNSPALGVNKSWKLPGLGAGGLGSTKDKNNYKCTEDSLEYQTSAARDEHANCTVILKRVKP